jgi:hypothetical protein
MNRALAFLFGALAISSALAQAPKPLPIGQVAEQYVKLGLALGEHDPHYVDAYYGPPAWREEMRRARWPLADISARAIGLLARLAEPGPEETRDEAMLLRYEFLRRQLLALATRVNMLQGGRRKFDDESRFLYGAVAPAVADAHFDAALEELDRLLPGSGPLVDRNEAYRAQFVIPAGRVKAVFEAAMAECRRRTLAHARLPAGEKLTVEFVQGKPWTAYQWYRGNFHSLIQVNTDVPMALGQALSLACHEGYPGHHVHSVLIEENLVRARGWVEFSLFALHSPQALLAEGAAEYGVELAFPGEERVRFWREVLFPLAGLDPARAGEYHRVTRAYRLLRYASIQAARRYLDGQMDRAATAAWLARYSLTPRAHAERSTRFFDAYRAYAVNYDLGRDLVRRAVEARAGAEAPPEQRWRAFLELLASPRLVTDERR